ncbi:GMC family oxidoreductase N-terminal domain-containing protein [Nocardia stercoris]|uniref:Cholesterol oxidase n=1 Tax=Nocardia stercoris TaxID=2483361 RepID=A0A3M2L0W2_9NOCA|nr:GMC family oxidoreductase [Nocardia stercoris]RMI31369.1 GMC family oxidoreductase [Nocardia stercoris]
MMGNDFDYDVLVIGSGFGGSVTALRLTEKGYRVGVVEAGRRWTAADLPSSNWNLRKSIWAPRLGLTGTQRISLLGKVTLFSAAGVGGGSLIYGNTLYRPLPKFYRDPSWSHVTDWEAELAPYYNQAERMLGVAPNPKLSPADEVLRDVAAELGVADTFHPTNVGVFFGEPGKTVPDPYFGGAGPERTGCVHCANCMTGCPHGAKNTTVTNYLYLAEQAGAQVHSQATVTDVQPLTEGGYRVTAQRSGGLPRRERREFTAEQVVFAAAARGTHQLLHQLRATGRLPALSPRMGELTRTNSEAVLTATSRTRTDFAQGVAITSSIHPEPDTHIEVCHYGKGQNGLFPLTVPMIDGGPLRFLRFLLLLLTHPLVFLRSQNVRRASERSVILLVMQSLDNSLTSFGKRGLFGYRLSTRQGEGRPNPTWIPIGHKANRLFADRIGGDALGMIMDVFDIPSTAHYIGGCPMGGTAAEGVIDPYHRIHNYPGLHVIDGSAVSANLGVNPSLTITAMSERACAFWPNRGEPDPRPALGAGYQQVVPVPPNRPAVPPTAPGVLRLPLTVVRPEAEPEGVQ